jgi:hypothetical protein
MFLFWRYRHQSLFIFPLISVCSSLGSVYFKSEKKKLASVCSFSFA